MVDVKRNIDGTLTFSYDGFTLPYVFVKVEQVAENSNYYCLWITEEEFHLFNIRTKEYALKINTYKESKIFSKIEFYSKDTRSFVAYRSDKEYAYLLFEDGEYENYVFKYVGKELNGIRAVKGHNNKWMYYNVLKKEFTFNINKGLLLRDDEELVPLFNLRYYTVYKVDLYYRLIFFDIQKRKTYYSDKIEYFEDSEDNRVIGKLFNRNVYALFKRTNLITPIGYFNSKPRYVYARNIFIAKKLNFYVIVDGNKEISNCQWTEDCFIFHNNYILNKSKGGIWKLYNFNDGKEICTNWTNIRYDSELCCIVADTDKQKNKKIAESDIEGLSNMLLEKSKKYFEYTEPNIAQQKICRRNNDVVSVKPQNEDKEIALNTSRYNELPPRIDFLAFVEHITISQDGYIISDRARKRLSVDDTICWIIQDKCCVAISRFLNTRAHKVIFLKENVDLNIFDKSSQTKSFIRTNIKITNGEDSLICELLKYKNGHSEKLQGEITNNASESTISMGKKTLIAKGMSGNNVGEFVRVPYHIDESLSKNVAEFYFDNIAYSLKVNDVWSKPDIFVRRQFVLKQNIVAILLDSTSEKFVKDNITYYEIIGEGKDKRFDQDFGPTNSSIRDNYRRIILFRKGSNGDVIFEDEVICVGFRIILAEECDKKSRKIIVFQLRSLLRNTPCKNQQLETENEVSIDDVATDISIVKNENVLDTDSIDDESNDKTNELLLNDEYNKIINEDHSMNNLDDKKALLQKLYQTMTTLKELGLKINNDLIAEIERLEGDIITNKLVPIISNKISDVLSPIKRNVTLIVDYEPNKPISIKISRNSNNVTVIKNEQQKEQINVEGIETHSKSARSNLRITLPNGRIIKHSTAVESLIEFILYVGIEKVEKVGLVRCKVPLISQNIDRKYSDRQKFIGNRRYLMTCTSTLAKKEDIEEIARYYNLNVKVEII